MRYSVEESLKLIVVMISTASIYIFTFIDKYCFFFNFLNAFIGYNIFD